ncbi:MAG TPA: 4Fe-4S dicluster domain-containing protein [Spirochaetota bacterium]|nr:4Fe-4S dicluster domain-containing protein [Spirochaetota bacterium]HPC41773.1 4Fe-4S dicluster domain-containing protein [Spirochaetota bacterium]HPL16557.1 4Fe-4S dicluster domain-containing protein [Spirochaetota bacterium]HQJ70287.1 4Fe-4S dicluster domain-containing protein [Spirochaetota bacterium]HRS78162.1 4Fe-4S dicluster domain-containing protein [Spirochaetota bacterium]
MIKTLLESTFLFACLYMALGICALGILIRIARWFAADIGPRSAVIPVWMRVAAATKGFVATVFSLRFFLFFKVLVLDVMLQARIIKTDLSRWIMHIFIFFGFMLLLLMHALDELVTKKVFPEYYSTLAPFQQLRNVFGLMVIVGVAMAIYRRVRQRGPMLITRYADRYAVIILAVIMISGFLVEASKITSESVFNRMMKDFSSAGGPADEDAIKAFWSGEYGTVFADFKTPVTPELIARGKQLNDESCGSCHAPTKTAFISFPVARALRPAAVPMDRIQADVILYYVHVLACFAGLAYLPFSKFFHIITDPLTMIVNGMSDKKKVNQAGAMPRRAMELDACTNCGTCSRYCSVAPVFRMTGNETILPSHKIRTIRSLSSGKKTGAYELRKISEGAFICTSCYRCTEVCPTGINLQDQWFASKELLAEKGYPLPHVWMKQFNASEWSDRIRAGEATREKDVDTIKGRYYNLTADSDVFAPCIQCQTCTNVCPVVAAQTDRKDAVDITPQKIMNLLRLGLNDLAMGSRMVWDCTTCYQCQEHCPQGIQVTDIIYELKNKAYGHFKNIDRTAGNDS